MTTVTDILVVGGYGTVGRRICARLAAIFPGRVAIAGRDPQRAAALSSVLGLGTRARRVDADDPASIGAALDGVGTVVMCVAQREMHLLRASIARGLGYTDIAPRLAFWQGAEPMGAEPMGAEARQTGARIVLGAGLSPGISNVMAARLAGAMGRIDHIETAILLSLGDEYGPDSLHHVLASVTQPFSVFRNGRSHAAVPFSDGQRIQFPEPLGRRTAYLFPWSDVVYYPKTLGAATAVGRFALDPPWAGRLASLLIRAGARRWLAGDGASQRSRHAIELVERRYVDHDRFALVVTAHAGDRTMRMSLTGRHQADATADGAAEIARLLVAGEVERPGVWLPEQVVQHDAFFRGLAAHGWKAELDEDRSAHGTCLA